MRLTDLLTTVTARQVQYYPALKPILGSATATIFFGQFLYWSGKEADPEGWIFKSQRELEEETGLTREEQEGARAKLRDRGVLMEQRRGLPCRLMYKLDLERVNKLWELHYDQKNQEYQRIGQLPHTSLRQPHKQERVKRTYKGAAIPQDTTLNYASDDSKTTTSRSVAEIDPQLLQDIVASSKFAGLDVQSLRGCVTDFGADQTMRAIDYCVWSRKAPRSDPASYVYGILRRGLSISRGYVPFSERSKHRANNTKKHAEVEAGEEIEDARRIAKIWESIPADEQKRHIEAIKQEQPALRSSNGVIITQAAMRRAARRREGGESLQRGPVSSHDRHAPSIDQ